MYINIFNITNKQLGKHVECASPSCNVIHFSPKKHTFNKNIVVHYISSALLS